MPNPVDPTTGRPRRGRPPQESTEHLIHSDGTYSNQPSEKTEKALPKIAVGSRVKMKDGKLVLVMHIDRRGVYVTPANFKRWPDLSQCSCTPMHRFLDEMDKVA